jgi:hypothetical protein
MGIGLRLHVFPPLKKDDAPDFFCLGWPINRKPVLELFDGFSCWILK